MRLDKIKHIASDRTKPQIHVIFRNNKDKTYVHTT